jgi:hypothetical protein
MTELPAYMGGLFAMLLVAVLTTWWHPEQRKQMLRTAAAILLNWLAGTVYVQNTGNYTPWHFSIFIDAAAALAVMYHPAGRAQGFIGLFYFFQIAGHTAFGIRRLLGLPADPVFYYDAITWVAWAQLAAMGVWCGGIWIGSGVRRLRGRGDASDRRQTATAPREKP